MQLIGVPGGCLPAPRPSRTPPAQSPCIGVPSTRLQPQPTRRPRAASDMHRLAVRFACRPLDNCSSCGAPHTRDSQQLRCALAENQHRVSVLEEHSTSTRTHVAACTACHVSQLGSCMASVLQATLQLMFCLHQALFKEASAWVNCAGIVDGRGKAAARSAACTCCDNNSGGHNLRALCCTGKAMPIAFPLASSVL